MSRIIKNHLADSGYEIIALPKADIAPLQLLTQQGKSLSRYGESLLLLFEPDGAGLPLRHTEAADIKGGEQFCTDVSTGLELLAGLFKALKLDESKLGASFNHLSGLEFSFSYEGIVEEYVSPMNLDNFISGAIPKKEGFETALERLRNSELYIITSVLKSDSMQLSLSSSKATEAELNAAIEQLVELNPNLDRLGSKKIAISATKEQPLAFAFKAVRVIYDKPSWFKFWDRKNAKFRVKNQQGMVMKGIEDFPLDVLKTEEGLVSF